MSSDSGTGSEFYPSEGSGREETTDEEMADQDLSSPGSSDEDMSGNEVGELVDSEIPDGITPSQKTNSSTPTTPSGELASNPVPKLYGSGNLRPGSYYRDRIRSFRDEPYLRKRYAPKTISALDRVLDIWRKFCLELNEPWLPAMKRMDLGVAEAFVHFYLNQQRGVDNRRKRGIKITRSLRTFWDTFRLLYRREALIDIDRKIDRNTMNNVIDTCARDFGLSDERKDNRPMTLDDLKLQIEGTLSTTEKAFKLGEHRILAVLYLLLLAPMGARPDSILKIQNKHIEVVLHQPKKGPQQLIIYVKLEFTKTYLGSKGVKTFIVPEVIFDPSLFLSPHVFLLAILFRRRAFAHDGLNDQPSRLAEMRIKDRRSMQLPIPLKEEMKDDYLFRAVGRGSMGFFLSDRPMTYDVVNKGLQRIGKILGFESNATSYCLRYMAGNNMNEDVNISRELQNLVMDHAPNSSTFQTNYLNRNITFDLWALHRGLAPQQDVVREAASFGYRRIEGRPTGLSKEESAQLKLDPEYKHYEAIVDGHVRGSPAWHNAKKDLRAALERLRRAATKKAIGRAWTNKYAMGQIGEMLDSSGTTSEAAEDDRRVMDPMPPAQQNMVDALYQPMRATLSEQLCNRSEAIDAIIAYCKVQEPLRPQLIRDQATKSLRIELPPILSAERVMQLRQLATVRYEDQKLLVCYLCVGQALTLPPGDPGIQLRCQEFSKMCNLTKHFQTVHMRFMKETELPPCPICIPRVDFSSFMYLQSHAQRIHGISQAKLWTGSK